MTSSKDSGILTTATTPVPGQIYPLNQGDNICQVATAAYTISQAQSLKANARIESFFNTAKMPYLMNGMENEDFAVSISRLGATESGDQYEFELSIHDPNLNVKDTIARATIHWDNPEDPERAVVVSEVVFEHDVESICKLHANKPRSPFYSYTTSTSIPQSNSYTTSTSIPQSNGVLTLKMFQDALDLIGEP